MQAFTDLLQEGKAIPTYEEALKIEPLRNAMTPGHNEVGQSWYDDERSDIPMHEELYYATVWIMFNGMKNPGTKDLIGSLREFFDEKFGGGG